MHTFDRASHAHFLVSKCAEHFSTIKPDVVKQKPFSYTCHVLVHVLYRSGKSSQAYNKQHRSECIGEKVVFVVICMLQHVMYFNIQNTARSSVSLKLNIKGIHHNSTIHSKKETLHALLYSRLKGSELKKIHCF